MTNGGVRSFGRTVLLPFYIQFYTKHVTMYIHVAVAPNTNRRVCRATILEQMSASTNDSIEKLDNFMSHKPLIAEIARIVTTYILCGRSGKILHGE